MLSLNSVSTHPQAFSIGRVEIGKFIRFMREGEILMFNLRSIQNFDNLNFIIFFKIKPVNY